jgi:lysophospholipase L1-like esterase
MVFYGDSITAGACNGDKGEDQYADMSTHDGSRAYGALVARRLNADYIGIAVSGTGVTRSWNEILLPEVAGLVAPQVNAPAINAADRTPDLVLINLGQNDFGYPQSQNEPFPSDFTARYVAFVQQLRVRYPNARIICLMGGMTGWRNSPDLSRGFKSAVQQLQQTDRQLWSYTFVADTDSHPRIDTHERMATELVKFLRQEVLH